MLHLVRQSSRPGVRWATALLVVVAVGCSVIRSPKVLEIMNDPSDAPKMKRAPAQARVARLVRTALADSYFVREQPGQNVVAWMQQIGANPTPLIDQLACLRKKLVTPEECYLDLRDALLPKAKRGDAPQAAGAWGVPAPPAIAGTRR